jgi:hypothetical protein
MLGAAPIRRRGVFLFVAALAALAAVPATAHGATASSQSLTGLWALEVTPRFAPSVRSRFIAHAKEGGINTIVLNRHLSPEQKGRVRSLARRFHLRVFPLRRLACQRDVKTCAVVARRPAAVRWLSRNPYVDIVALRLRGPRPVSRLARRYAHAVDGTASAGLLLLPTLRPRISRAAWRRAISAVADAGPVALGVTPSGRSSTRAFSRFVGVLTALQSSPSASSTPPPPPPPSPPAGQLYFRGDWEMDGEILGMPAPILGQYNGAQCENTKVTMDTPTFNRGRLYVVSDIVGGGSKAARFDLPSDGLRSQACEALHGRKLGTGHGYPPFEEWYALSIRFPANYTTQGWGLTVASLNYQTIWGAPLGILAVGPAVTGEPNHVRLQAQAGECVPVTEPNPHCEWSSGPGGNARPMRIIPPERFATEVWHDLLVHVVWSTQAREGLIEGFHRQRGGEWANTVPAFTGKPTVQWRPGTSVHPSNGTVDKIGAYRGPNSTELSIWHDNFCVAATRAAAESCL